MGSDYITHTRVDNDYNVLVVEWYKTSYSKTRKYQFNLHSVYTDMDISLWPKSKVTSTIEISVSAFIKT